MPLDPTAALYRAVHKGWLDAMNGIYRYNVILALQEAPLYGPARGSFLMAHGPQGPYGYPLTCPALAQLNPDFSDSFTFGRCKGQ